MNTSIILALFSALLSAALLTANTVIAVTLMKLKNKVTKTDSKHSHQTALKLSVVVAARNEEKNIPKLIKALSEQEYCSSDFEVIIVDDNSEDDTYKTAVDRTEGLENFRVVKAVNKPYPAKKGALSVGIEYSHHPYIAITDADCIPEGRWLKMISRGLSEGNAVVFGAAPFLNTGSLVNRISRFENLRAAMLTFASASAGFPYSAAARSMAYSREAFLKIGGYSKTTDTLSGDDDLLIREAVRNSLKAAPAADECGAVYSASEETLKGYLRQKSRHTSTSNHYLLSRQLMLLLWHGINILSLFSPLLLTHSLWTIVPFILKLTSDILLVKAYQRLFRASFTIKEILIHQPLYELFLIVNYVLGLFKGKTRWN